MLNRKFKPEFYILAGQILAGEQQQLEEILIDQTSEWLGRDITLEEMTVNDIVGFLVDNIEELNQFIK